jgi:hypothetical protein
MSMTLAHDFVGAPNRSGAPFLFPAICYLIAVILIPKEPDSQVFPPHPF